MTVNNDGLWNEIRFREFEFRAEDALADSVPCVVSTDAPVMMGDGEEEILQHSATSIDLSRAPLPLIDVHNPKAGPFGVVEALQVVAGRLRGNVRFGNTSRAKELLADVKAGILRSLSVGYRIVSYHYEGARRIVTRWMPYEVSCVPVPADPGAGFFRSAESIMHLSEERERAAGIVRASRMFDSEARVLDAIESGESLSEFRQRAMLQGLTRPAAIGMSRSEVKRYSLSRVLSSLTQSPGHRERTFEWEVHDELVRLHGEPDSGGAAYLPADVFQQYAGRDLTVASFSGGGALVETGNYAGFVELVRPRSVALTLGAETLEGLRGNLTLPRIAAGVPITWLNTESMQGTEGQPSLGSIAFTPKTAMAYTEFSRQLLLQSNPSVNRVLANDLLRATAAAVDVAVLNGSGTSGQPLGILNTPGIGSFSGTSLALTGALGAQTDVGDNLSPACGYATTREVAAVLAAREKFTGNGDALWTGNLYEGQLAGYRSMTSGNMPIGAMLFGDWPSVLVATWGTLSVEINPFANFPVGIVAARVMHSLDVGVRRLSAFTAASAVT